VSVLGEILRLTLILGFCCVGEKKMKTVDENIRECLKLQEIEMLLDKFAKESNLKFIIRWDDISNLWMFEFLNTRQKVGCRYSVTMNDLFECPSDKLCDVIIAQVMKTKII
jgi:hypothetical protein